MKKTLIAVALFLLAAGAFANGHGGGPGGGPGGPGDLGHGGGYDDFLIGDNGSVYFVDDGTLKAINTSGAVAWSATLDSARSRVVLSGSNLIALTVTQATTTTAASSKLTAYSAASGATAWTLTLDGVVTSLRPFSGGTYAVVVTPAATSGAEPTHTLVAISNSGAVLWKLTL